MVGLWLALAVFSTVLHELGHAVAMKVYGCPVLEFKLGIVGGQVTADAPNLTRKEGIVIALAGIAVNILLVLAAIPFLDTITGTFVALMNVLLIFENLAPAGFTDGHLALNILTDRTYSFWKRAWFCAVAFILMLLSAALLPGVIYAPVQSWAVLLIPLNFLSMGWRFWRERQFHGWRGSRDVGGS